MFDFLSLVSWFVSIWVAFQTEVVDVNQLITKKYWTSNFHPTSSSRAEQLVDEDSRQRSKTSPRLISTRSRSPAPVSVQPNSEAGDDNNPKSHICCDSSSKFLAPPSPPRSVSSTTNLEVENSFSIGSSLKVNYACQDHLSKDPVQPHWSLLDELCEELIDWPKGGINRYLPDDQFRHLITLGSVEAELRKSQMKDVFGVPNREMIRLIFERFARIFTVLVLSDLTRYIYDFVEEDLHDGHLPLRRDGSRGFVSRIRPDYQIKCTKNWGLNSIRKFDSDQWSLVTPIFKRSSSMDIIEHYALENNQMMPLILDASDDPARVKRGGFGEVYEVIFHPAHQFLARLSDFSKTLNPSFAVKRQLSRDEDAFNREVKMHKLLSGGRYHSHLAQLVATYEHRGRFHLIFPFAKCNLRTYWKQTPCPDFSQITVGWFLRQVKGLASAVQRIHGYRDTHHALGSIGPSEDPMAPNVVASDEEQPYYGRHGDIKAENILWSDEDSRDEDARFTETGLLILADFGEMRHYQTSTKFRTLPDQVAESPAYAPPEATSFTACAQTSRAYDIWSLGCVFLEFTIWLLCDWEELCRFTEERGTTFYTILKSDPHGQAATEAVLNERVRECISNLHRKSRCSRFIHEVLDLISRMLVVDPALRITSGQLNAQLSSMVHMASKTRDYLIEPRPSHALCCCQRISSCPKQGTPLPARPSVVKDMKSSEQTRGKIPPEYYWDLAMDSRSPGRNGKSSVAVARWTRAVSKFHPHKAQHDGTH